MRFFPFFAVAMLAVVSAPAARADEKSDAILKEARLRAAYFKTYSVTLRAPTDSVEYMRIFLSRPDRLRIELNQGKGQKILIVVNRASAMVEENGKREIVPANTIQADLSKLRNIALGNLEDLIGKVTKTTYVTQKVLDETIIVDVIDILGTTAGKSARLYIDNNGQIRKVVGRTLNKTPGILIFENPITDEPIPDKLFAIPKDNS